MMDGHSSCAPWAPGSNLAVRVNGAIDDRPGIQQDTICYQLFKQRLILSVSKPSISQRSQIKEDTVKPSVPAREFNLKAYAAIPESAFVLNKLGWMTGATVFECNCAKAIIIYDKVDSKCRHENDISNRRAGKCISWSGNLSALKSFTL